ILLTDNSNDGSIEWKGKIEGPPSSTRAELFAILTVLWISPYNSQIEIYTDSEASIGAINGYTGQRKGKHWSNYSNPILLQTISELIITKNLIIGLNKVMAHQGDELNERADSLAKKGRESGPLWKINSHILRIKHYHFKWKNESI